MIVRRGKGDLNKIYRPCKISEAVGHSTIKNTIGRALDKGTLPHSLLFTGQSGCGKTTFARMIALGLNCLEGMSSNPCCKCASCKAILNLNSLAVIEVDAARTSDVNTTRSVIDDLPAAPMGGEAFKVAIFDEAHNLSGKAEDALLKVLEDTPNHVYIILCTNQAYKLKEVTRNRCKTIQFGRLADAHIYKLLEQVCQFEGFEYKEEVLNYIVKESSGVPRAALSFLQQVASEGSWTKDAASIIINAGIDIDYAELIDFCRVLIKGSFRNSLKFYKDMVKVKKIPAETIRINSCGYFVGCLRNAKTEREANNFSAIIDILAVPFYNYPKPEHMLINNMFKISRILRSGNVKNNKWSNSPGFASPKV
ncbi:MAG: DNA polymerase III subunit [Candidatus Hodarchaeales archaeon]|jgi:DNA polymerase III subunit gamma/tau